MQILGYTVEYSHSGDTAWLSRVAGRWDNGYQGVSTIADAVEWYIKYYEFKILEHFPEKILCRCGNEVKYSPEEVVFLEDQRGDGRMVIRSEKLLD